MKNKKLRITEKDFLLANRRASRAEEIEKYGKQISMRSITHKSKKVYDRNRLKKAGIKYCDDLPLLCYIRFHHLTPHRSRKNRPKSHFTPPAISVR